MARGQNEWYTLEYKMDVVQKYLSDNYKVEPFCREIFYGYILNVKSYLKTNKSNGFQLKMYKIYKDVLKTSVTWFRIILQSVFFIH